MATGDRKLIDIIWIFSISNNQNRQLSGNIEEFLIVV